MPQARNRLSPRHKMQLWTLVAVYVLNCFVGVVQAYPLISEVPENTERCVRFNIPEDDDAHMVFLALPTSVDQGSDEEEASKIKWADRLKRLEEYFVDQLYQLTKARSTVKQDGGPVPTTLPRTFPKGPPSEIQSIISDFIDYTDGEARTRCTIRILNPKSASSRIMESFWFAPLVVNHVRQAVKSRNQQEWEAPPLEGYSICFYNQNEDQQVKIAMDVVMVSDSDSSDDEEDGKAAFDSSHLTPLAEHLQESITLANSVMKEMRYMEKREQRMRITSDSINTRVRYFSYISVGVLLAVTYVQVTYLKRYFRKKKLL